VSDGSHVDVGVREKSRTCVIVGSLHVFDEVRLKSRRADARRGGHTLKLGRPLSASLLAGRAAILEATHVFEEIVGRCSAPMSCEGHAGSTLEEITSA